MKKLTLPTVVILLLAGLVAFAQDIANHSMPVGGGPGAVGWKTAGPCTSNQVLAWTGGATVDPGCSSVTSLLTLPWTVAQGGTGQTTLTQDGILFGNGTSAVGSNRCTMDTNQSVVCQSSTSFKPEHIIQNTTADANSALLGLYKSRSGGNTLTNDVLGQITWKGFANAAYQNSASLNCFQNGASSGSNVPSSCQVTTSTTGGQLNTPFRFPPTTGAAANQLRTDGTGITFWANNGTSANVNVMDPPYNAVCDGSTDDSTAIQAAVNAVPATGGVVTFPSGRTCKMNSTLSVGNGSTTTASTRQGTILRCDANPLSSAYFGNIGGLQGSCRLLSAVGGGAPAVVFLGPYQGGGIENLIIDCNGTVGVGLKLISVMNASFRNMAINLCTAQGILTNSVPQGGGSFGDSNVENNLFLNTYISVNNTANAIGIQLTGTGTADSTSNSDFNTFVNTKILLPLAATALTGINLQSSDSNTFYNTLIFGGGAGCTAVSFDYSAQSGLWPASNAFYTVDPGSNCTTKFANNGTPSANAGTKPNYIYGLVETNGATAPILANLAVHSSNSWIPNPGNNNTRQDALAAWTTFTPSPTCGTATITTTGARRMSIGKTTFIYAEFLITVLGTCTNTFAFTAPATANQNGAYYGQEVANTGKAISCFVASGTTTVSPCRLADGANFAVNARLVLNGVYETQ